MGKILKIIGVFLGVLVIAAAVVGFLTFYGKSPVRDGQALGDGVTVVKDGFTSLVVVPLGADQGVALIDAGNDRGGAPILAELRRRNLGADAVKAIFLTHGHPDHIGALSVFPKAEVIALAEEVPLVQGQKGAMPLVARLLWPKGLSGKVTRTVKDGDTVKLGEVDFRVFAMPGHTKGSAAYLARGILFLGDSADANDLAELVPGKWLFSESPSRNKASLKALAARLAPEERSIKRMVPSHSAPLPGFEPLLAYARR